MDLNIMEAAVFFWTISLSNSGGAIPIYQLNHPIVKMNDPVIFNQMDNKNKEVNAEVVFFILINEKEKQSEFLSKLIMAFQNPEFLKSIKESNDKEFILNLVAL